MLLNIEGSDFKLKLTDKNLISVSEQTKPYKNIFVN